MGERLPRLASSGRALDSPPILVRDVLARSVEHPGDEGVESDTTRHTDETEGQEHVSSELTRQGDPMARTSSLVIVCVSLEVVVDLVVGGEDVGVFWKRASSEGHPGGAGHVDERLAVELTAGPLQPVLPLPLPPQPQGVTLTPRLAG